MSKIVGVHGATNSNFHDHNHRAYVFKQLRVVANRHDKTATVNELLNNLLPPIVREVLDVTTLGFIAVDGLTSAIINAVEQGNKLLDAEEANKEAAKVKASEQKIVVKKKSPAAIKTKETLEEIKEDFATAKTQIAKESKLQALAKESIVAKLTLETVLFGKPFREWTYEDICEAGDRFAKIKDRMQPGQKVSDVFTSEEFVELMSS